MNEVQKAALELHRLGYAITDLPYGTKRATRKGWLDEELTEADINQRFGGDPVNLGVLLGERSNGLIRVDLDSPEALKVAPYLLPPTGLVMSRGDERRSGYFYRVNGCVKNASLKDPIVGDPKKATIVEVLSTGKHSVVPPSVHPSGDLYSWDEFGEPSEISEDELQVVNKVHALGLLARYWPDGSRNAVTMALAGWCLQGGLSLDEVERYIRVIVDAAGDDEISMRLAAVRGTQEKISRGESVTGIGTLKGLLDRRIVFKVGQALGLPLRDPGLGAQAGLRATDTGNAERFQERHGADVRYSALEKCWYLWDGKRWCADQRQQVWQLAIDTARAIHLEVATLTDRQDIARLSDWAVKSLSARRLEDQLKIASTLEGIAILPSEFDQDHFLINVQNGTLNLKTGELQEHSREDMITKLAPVKFVPDARAPMWESHLDRIMGGDPKHGLTTDTHNRKQGDTEMIEYLQEALGYSLTGDQGERCFFVFHGCGHNGKSVVVDTVAALMGDYAVVLSAQTLLKRREGAATNDILDMKGARLATTDETAIGAKLAADLIKALTGSKRYKARRLYQENQEFSPTAKIVISTNFRPDVDQTDQAMWDRIRPIEFGERISDAEKVSNFTDKLVAEEPEGIFAWLVEGCRRWQQRGRLVTPTKVRLNREAYQKEMDIIGDFLDEHSTREPGKKALFPPFYQAFRGWCKDMGMGERDIPAKSAFKQYLQGRGHEVEVSTGNRQWIGDLFVPVDSFGHVTTNQIGE